VPRFRETTATHRHSISLARRGGQLITNWKCEGCWTCKLRLLQIVSLPNYHIEIVFGRKPGDGSCVTGGIDRPISNIDDVALIQVICVPIMLRGSCFWISVTKLWDMIIFQCLYKGRTGHLKDPDAKSSWWMTNKRYISLSATVKLEIKTSIALAKCKMCWKSLPNNSATLNSHTDPSRCTQILPDRLNAKWCALRCSETTSPVLLHTPEVVEQNPRISWRVHICLQTASKLNY
jgi:hypothetical protein